MDIKTAQQINQPPIYKMPLLGERAAPFKAETTKGPINFPFDYSGKWVIFFSHPGDFQPVCTTEIIAFQTVQQEFKDINTELLGLSVDSIDSHLGWLDSIYNLEWNGLKDVSINYPIVSDPTMEISRKYGMIHRGESETNTIRTLFVIDPDAKIRNILYYSNTTGRNLEEVKRIVLALQESDTKKLATPANWMPGEDLIIPSAKTTAEVMDRYRLDTEDDSVYCLDWYMCFKSYTSTSHLKKNSSALFKRGMPPVLKP